MEQIAAMDQQKRYYTSTPEMLKKYAEMVPPVDEQKWAAREMGKSAPLWCATCWPLWTEKLTGIFSPLPRLRPRCVFTENWEIIITVRQPCTALPQCWAAMRTDLPPYWRAERLKRWWRITSMKRVRQWETISFLLIRKGFWDFPIICLRKKEGLPLT